MADYTNKSKEELNSLLEEFIELNNDLQEMAGDPDIDAEIETNKKEISLINELLLDDDTTQKEVDEKIEEVEEQIEEGEEIKAEVEEQQEDDDLDDRMEDEDFDREVEEVEEERDEIAEQTQEVVEEKVENDDFVDFDENYHKNILEDLRKNTEFGLGGNLVAGGVGAYLGAKYPKSVKKVTDPLDKAYNDIKENLTGEKKFENGGELDDLHERVEDLVKDLSSDEYEVFAFDNNIDPEDANEMSDFIYDLNKKEAEKIIAQLKGKYAKGGKISDEGFAYLMELWFAVHQRETDKYNSISKKLDKEGVPFSIQNKVSSNASESRSKKSIDTLEVKDRIEKIISKSYAKGGKVDNVKRYLDEFPNDATSWADATDEIRDLSRASKEYVNEYDLDVLDDDPKAVKPLDFRELKKPSQWNTEGKKYILKNIDKMSDRTFELFYNDYRDWFDKSYAKGGKVDIYDFLDKKKRFTKEEIEKTGFEETSPNPDDRMYKRSLRADVGYEDPKKKGVVYEFQEMKSGKDKGKLKYFDRYIKRGYAKGGKVKRYIVHKGSGYDGEVVGSSDTFRGASMIQKRLEKKGVFDDVDTYGIKDTEDYFYRRKDNKYAKGGRVMSVERLAQKLERAYPRIRMSGLSSNRISIYEPFPTDRNGDSIADYYSESQDRTFGVINHFNNFLERNGFYAEWQNPEHLRIYKKDYAEGGELDDVEVYVDEDFNSYTVVFDNSVFEMNEFTGMGDVNMYIGERNEFPSDLGKRLSHSSLPPELIKKIKQRKTMSFESGGKIQTRYEVELIENVENNPKRAFFIVNQRTFDDIERLQYAGGFKRFEIDLYEDDSKKNMSNINELDAYIRSLGIAPEMEFEDGGVIEEAIKALEDSLEMLPGDVDIMKEIENLKKRL